VLTVNRLLYWDCLVMSFGTYTAHLASNDKIVLDNELEKRVDGSDL
jgi:hypothetical protein